MTKFQIIMLIIWVIYTILTIISIKDIINKQFIIKNDNVNFRTLIWTALILILLTVKAFT